MARGAHRVKLSEHIAHAVARRVARGALQSNGAAQLYSGGGVLARHAAARAERSAMPIGRRLAGLNLSAPGAGLSLPSSGVADTSASAPTPLQPNMAQPQNQSQGASPSRIVRPAPQTMTQGQRDYFAYVDRVAAEARANANARAQEALQAQLAQRDQGSGLPANIAMSTEPLRHGYTPTAYGDEDYQPQGNAQNWDPTLKPVKADFSYHSQESGGVGTVYPNRPSDETSPTVPSSTVPLEDGDAVANTGGGGGGGAAASDENNDDASNVVKQATKKTWSQQSWGERLHSMWETGSEGVAYNEATHDLDNIWGVGSKAATAEEVGFGTRLLRGAARGFNWEGLAASALYERYQSQHPDPDAPGVTSPDEDTDE